MAHATQSLAKENKKSPLLLGSTAITGIRSIAAITAGIVGLAANTAHAQVAADALPTAGSVASGTATIVYDAVDPRLDINQTSNNAIFDWDTFNIGTDANAANNGGVFFNQNSATSIAVNRVSDVNPSQILGDLTADGQVVILNQNGVFFGSTASVDVAGLVASSGTIDAGAFIADGTINLSDINAVPGAKIENRGLISIKDGGLAAFVAPHLINNGIINANLGRVALASGNTATVDLFGDGLVSLALDDQIEGAIIENNGTIAANGGTIAMTTAAAKGIVDSVINLDGIVEAKTVGVKNGKIILGGVNTKVTVSGKVEGSNKKTKATITGEEVVLDGAEIQAKTTINADGADADILFKGANKFFNLVAISRDDILVEEGASITSNRKVSLTANNEDNDGLSVLQIEGLIQTTNKNGKGQIELSANNYFVEIDSTGSIITDGSDFTVTSDHGFDIDENAVVNLGDGNVFIDAPDVNLGADINTTGTITGTAMTVDVENDTAEIQDGVDVAAKNATVNVGAGTYDESVLINKAVKVIGESRNTVTVTPTSNAQDGFTIDGAIDGNVNIQRMTISGAQDGIDVKDTTTGLNRLVIGGMLFQNNDRTGIRVTGNSVNETRIVNSNFIDNGWGGGSKGEGDILFFLHNGDISIENVNIQNNSPIVASPDGPVHAADYGIQIRGSDPFSLSGDITLDNVTVSGAYRAGQIGVQIFSGLKSFTTNNVTIGGQAPTKNSGGFGALYLGSIGDAGISDIDLSGVTFNALDPNLNYLANFTLMDIDARNTNFEGVIGNTATVEQSFAIEDRVSHKMDDPTDTIGLVTWKDNTLFATTNNEGIQHAVNIANTGNDIFVDDGTYNESVTVDKTVQVYGNNHGLAGTDVTRGDETIVVPNSPAFLVTADDVVIDGFYLTGGKGDTGVFVKNADRATITNNVITGQQGGNGPILGDGIFLQNSNASTVSNNYIHDLGDDGIQGNNADNITVTNNTIERVGDAGIAIIAQGGNGSANVTITGNTVTDANKGFGIRASGTGSVNVSGNTVTNAGDANRDFQNDAIHIDGGYSSGTVNDNVVNGSADSGIELEGTSNLVANNNRVSNTAGNGIYVNGSDFTEITNSFIDGTDGVGILVNPSLGVKVKGNTIDNTGSHGIHIMDSADAQVRRNFIGTTGGEENINGDGIFLERAHGARVINNTITETESPSNAFGSGIQSRGSNNIRLARNTISNVDWDGVRIAGGSGITVHDNDITNSQRTGIYSGNATNNRITENTITGTNSHHGIDVQRGKKSTKIRGNTISGTNRNGILVGRTAGLVVDDNTIDDTGRTGIDISRSNGSRVTFNYVGTNGVEDNINGNGIKVSRSDDVKILDNRVRETTDDGIDAEYIEGLRIRRNNLRYIGDDGIDVEYAYDVRITDNKIKDVDENGIDIYDVEGEYEDELRIRRNTIRRSGDNGISVEDVEHVDIRNNLIRKAGEDAISLYDFDSAYIINNDIKNTGDDGIEAVLGNYVRIARNTLDRIGYYTPKDSDGGVTLLASTDTIVSEGEEGDILGADAIFVAGVGFNEFSDREVRISAEDDVSYEEEKRRYGVEIVNKNTITNVHDDGVQVLFSGDTLVRNNDITNVGVQPAFLGGDAVSIIGFPGFISEGQGLIRSGLSRGFLGDTRGLPIEKGIFGPETFAKVVNNRIDTAEDDGIEIIGINEVRVKKNNIKNVGDDAIHLEGFGGFPEEIIDDEGDENLGFEEGDNNIGVAVFAVSNMRYQQRQEFNAIVKENEVENSGGDGIESTGFDRVEIDGNTIDESTENGILISGPRNGDVVITDNTLTDNTVGMRFESGAIDLSGETNVINGGSIGLQFDPFLNQFESDEDIGDEEVEQTEQLALSTASLEPFIGPVSELSLVDDTFGTTEFNEQSDFYIRLEDGALFAPGEPTVLDALDVSFDGVTPSDTAGVLTPDEFSTIDGQIFDFNDEDNRGLIFFGISSSADINDILPDQNIGALINNPNALLTILGLPFVSPTGGGLPASILNNLAPAAGGDGEVSPEELNELETAAGSEKVGCWTDAFSSLGSGATAVSYNISTDALSQVSDANGCGL